MAYKMPTVDCASTDPRICSGENRPYYGCSIVQCVCGDNADKTTTSSKRPKDNVPEFCGRFKTKTGHCILVALTKEEYAASIPFRFHSFIHFVLCISSTIQFRGTLDIRNLD